MLLVPAAVTLGLLAFYAYVAVRLRRGVFQPTRSEPPLDVEVLDVSDDEVTLRPASAGASPRWRLPGIWGLDWAGGHGRVGEILESGNTHVTRRWKSFEGKLAAGEMARIGPAAFPLDPRIAFGLTFRKIRYESSVGQFDAPLCDGSASTWVLFVHGKRGARPRLPPYSYPILPVVREFGLPCLDVAYRNDPGHPPGDGLHWYGLKEWEDLEAAARCALEHGAEDLVLVGYSMGGAIALSFLYRSELASRVRGTILDAPVLDLKAVIDAGMRMRGLPLPLFRPALGMLREWLGIDWESFDYLRDAERLSAPILLFHGDRDTVVPMETSDELARRRPDIVTYVRVEGAPHTQAWNLDPERYEKAVRDFLTPLLSPSS